MDEPSEPLRVNEVGTYGDLAQRPNPDGLVILPIPPIEALIPALQQQLGRELTPEEVGVQRRKAPSIVITKEAAEQMMAERARRGTAVPTGGRLQPPTVSRSYDEMPTEAADRREAAVEFFGQHLFSLRNQLDDRLRRLIESAETRGRLGSLHRKEYEAVAALDPAGREAALALARKAIDNYLQDILALFTGTGDSLSLGHGHAINYRLILQVKEVGSDAVIEEFAINRECQKVFGQYYNRWLNRYSDHR
jgi:hypothetical protein